MSLATLPPPSPRGPLGRRHCRYLLRPLATAGLLITLKCWWVCVNLGLSLTPDPGGLS